jgi:hypothetical protein
MLAKSSMSSIDRMVESFNIQELERDNTNSCTKWRNKTIRDLRLIKNDLECLISDLCNGQFEECDLIRDYIKARIASNANYLDGMVK